MTGFYMKCHNGLKWFKKKLEFLNYKILKLYHLDYLELYYLVIGYLVLSNLFLVILSCFILETRYWICKFSIC